VSSSVSSCVSQFEGGARRTIVFVLFLCVIVLLVCIDVFGVGVVVVSVEACVGVLVAVTGSTWSFVVYCDMLKGLRGGWVVEREITAGGK
jgi:hypothetical protein